MLALLTSAQTDPDGWIKSTQRAMAEAIGVSAAEVNRQIADLAGRKIIEARTGRTGTALRIISKPKSAVNLRAVPRHVTYS